MIILEVGFLCQSHYAIGDSRWRDLDLAWI